MTTLETETILAINWLEQRSDFDDHARSRHLLEQAVEALKNINTPVVVDIGAGTGNHSLYLHQELADDFPGTTMIMVEQHAHLLAYAKDQVSIPNIQTTNPVDWKFIHADMLEWLTLNAGTQSINLLTNNALLDLLTSAELADLIGFLALHQLPMYSTLNYLGVSFDPIHPSDQDVISLFEHHMCRALDRGHPLGARVNEHLGALVSTEPTLCLSQAGSDWHITSDAADFLAMNLDFYEQGARITANSSAQDNLITNWSKARRALLAEGQLALTVRHQDYLVQPVKQDNTNYRERTDKPVIQVTSEGPLFLS